MLRWMMGSLVALAILCGSAPSHGDGKIFPRVGFGRVETPAQRALVHWAEGVETLVIETTVRSDATNLAWILPLPAAPTLIRAVDSGVFPTLQTVFRPQITHEPSLAWVGGLVVAALVLVVRWQIQGKLLRSLFEVFLCLLLVAILGAMLLPSLAKAKGGGGTHPGETTLQLLAEGRAGVFDVTTLTARNPEDVLDWLRGHGFDAPAGLRPVVADYLARGWVFAAARVENPAAGVLAGLHPIAFTFPVARPVYPMKLTGIGGGTLTCDLYVFGPGRAAAAGWKAAYCAQPSYPTHTTPESGRAGLRVRQWELVALARQAPVATKLSAALHGSGFEEDVLLSFERYVPVGQTAYTRQAAFARAAWVGSCVLAVALLLGSLPIVPRTGTAPWFSALDRSGLIAAVIVGVLFFAATPTVRETSLELIQRHPWSTGRHQASTYASLAEEIDEVQAALNSGPATKAVRLAVARHALREWLRTNTLALQYPEFRLAGTNVFSSERLRLESSPGNLSLEPSTNGLDVAWHDFDGYPASRYAIQRLEPAPPAAEADRQLPR